MSFVVEIHDPYSEHPHPTDGRSECETLPELSACIEDATGIPADTLLADLKAPCEYCNAQGWIETCADHCDGDGEYIGSEPVQAPCPACNGDAFHVQPYKHVDPETGVEVTAVRVEHVGAGARG